MADDRSIARWRLANQGLVAPHLASAAAVVDRLLAVQAENLSQAAWAVASRTTSPSASDLAELLDDGRVLRTHVLRPTWHFVGAGDLVWLLELTAPRVKKVTGQQLYGEGAFDAPGVVRALDAVQEAIRAGGPQTRAQLAEALARRGFDVSGFLLMILVGHAELEGLLCSGPPSNGEHTYALLPDRVPDPRRLSREEALAEIALRYFSGHGPATERDLTYWATLTLTDVRAGLAAVRDQLESFEHDGRTFWHAPGSPSPGPLAPSGHLLQILDETYRGYQDSRWAIDADGHVPRKRETAIGMALVDAQMVAGMRRTLGRQRVTFELQPYRDLARDALDALHEAAGAYGRFLGLEAALEIK